MNDNEAALANLRAQRSVLEKEQALAFRDDVRASEDYTAIAKQWYGQEGVRGDGVCDLPETSLARVEMHFLLRRALMWAQHTREVTDSLDVQWDMVEQQIEQIEIEIDAEVRARQDEIDYGTAEELERERAMDAGGNAYVWGDA